MLKGLRYAFLVPFCFFVLNVGCFSQATGHDSTNAAAEVLTETKSIAFDPAYTLRPGESAYARAQDIYQSCTNPPAQGVYRQYGLVFVVVCIDTNTEKLRYLEGTAMLRANALLRNAFEDLPAAFTLKNRLLEKTLDDDTGIYRYALVFREIDVKNAIDAGKRDNKGTGI